jgi:DNA-binding SARP family transcriptional activator
MNGHQSILPLSSASLHINLFGRFSVRHDNQLVEGLAGGKVQELLAYLLLYRDRPHSRDVLADRLWPECETDQQRKYLRHALWQLQSTLGHLENNSSARSLLQIEPNWVSLNRATPFWLDVAVLEAASARVLRVQGQAFDRETTVIVQDAVDLYAGDLLEGWYQDWCVNERDRLQQVYIMLVEKLIVSCEAHYDFEVGLWYGNRILAIERTHEATHRRMMRLRYLLGDRTGALRQYHQCRSALHVMLAVTPAQETTWLYEQIRGDQFAAIRRVIPTNHKSSEANPLLSSVLDRVGRLELIIEEIKNELQKSLQSAECPSDRAAIHSSVLSNPEPQTIDRR